MQGGTLGFTPLHSPDSHLRGNDTKHSSIHGLWPERILDKAYQMYYHIST